MDNMQPNRVSEASLGFAVRFVLKFLGFTLLISVVPLVFVNLPLRMLLINFEYLYPFLMILANFLALLLSASISAKLLFALGVGGFKFELVKLNTK